MRQPHGIITHNSSPPQWNPFLRDLCVLLFKSLFRAIFETEERKDREAHYQRRLPIASVLILMSAALCSEVIAGPRVDIVIGEKAPALERLAADELASQLKRVYEADIKISSIVPADSPHVIFVGSPDTNASMKPFADSWPSGDKKLTDQGHLLRSVTHNNKPALLVGGGSPVATYWAVAEFGHRLGIRSMLFGDLDPVSPPTFTLEGFDVLMEPIQRIRGWQFSNHSPMDSGAWSLDEYQLTLKQLAKLKFNRVRVVVGASEPFVHFEYAGVKRQTGLLWNGRRYQVSGDTSGRKAFGGAKFFDNPNFASATSYEERIAVGKKLLTGVIDAAHTMGMTVCFELPFAEFPKEFISVLPDQEWFPVEDGFTAFVSIKDLARDERHAGLVKAQWRAYLDTYPTIDSVELNHISFDSERNAVSRFFAEPRLLRRANERDLDLRILTLRDDSKVAMSFAIQGRKEESSSKIGFVRINGPGFVFPLARLSDSQDHLGAKRQAGYDGFSVITSVMGDVDYIAYWLSRANFDQALTSERILQDFVEPVCGQGVYERVDKAFELIEQASEVSEDDWGIGNPSPEMLNEISSENDPPPALWGQRRDEYLNAMNEMYRANTRAREGGRAFTLYWARRCEFAFEYMNCIEAVRKAGIAERKKDTDTQIVELEKAIESLNNALNAMAAVARSNSDRGLIAVLNEHGYRPLKKKLAEAEEAAK